VCCQLESSPVLEDAPLSTDSTDQAASAVMKTLLETSQERMERVQRGLRNAARFSTTQMVENYIHLYRRILGIGAERQPCGKDHVLVPR
jgi:hypothetical protein